MAANIFGDDIIRIIYEAKVIIPSDVLNYLNQIHCNLRNPNVEFGIYMKGELVKDSMTFVIRPGEDNRHLPRQVVGTCSLRFTEGPPSNSFNAALHRHPSGVRGFSGTDRESINQDWDCSILFIPPNDFPAAVINIDMTNTTRFQVPARVEIVPSEESMKFISTLESKIMTEEQASKAKSKNASKCVGLDGMPARLLGLDPNPGRDLRGRHLLDLDEPSIAGTSAVDDYRGMLADEPVFRRPLFGGSFRRKT